MVQDGAAKAIEGQEGGPGLPGLPHPPAQPGALHAVAPAACHVSILLSWHVIVGCSGSASTEYMQIQPIHAVAELENLPERE